MLHNKYIIPINQPLTDSLSLSIPEDKIHVIDLVLISKVSTFYVDIGEDGLIDDENDPMPPKPYKHQKNGITLRFMWVNYPCNETQSTKRFLKITLSAKILREKYFQGITLDNIKDCYNYIMDIGAFSCTYHDFLNGSVSDIDICVNYRLDANSLHDSLKRFPSFYAKSKARYFHLIAFKNKHNKLINLGMDINTRQKAKPSLPYFKIYHKELELLSKSAEFYNTYLFPNFDIKNLCRSEFTIKSYKHKQRLQKVGLPMFTTLLQYLQIDKKTLQIVHDTGVPSYTIKREPRSEIVGLSPTDTLLYHFMQLAIKNGSDIDNLKEVLEQFDGSRRTRVKDKINLLYNMYITNDTSNKKTAEKNSKINTFLRRFNLID